MLKSEWYLICQVLLCTVSRVILNRHVLGRGIAVNAVRFIFLGTFLLFLMGA